jgi:hypothetical protein
VQGIDRQGSFSSANTSSQAVGAYEVQKREIFFFEQANARYFCARGTGFVERKYARAGLHW